MKKKMMAHPVDPVSVAMASGYTMNTRPGPGGTSIVALQTLEYSQFIKEMSEKGSNHIILVG